MGKSHFAVCPEGEFSFTSPCSLSFLRAIIPHSILILSLLFILPYPPFLRHLLSPLTSIFHDPTSFRNLAPPKYEQILREKGNRGPPRWVNIVLIGSGLVGSTWWLGVMGWKVVEILGVRGEGRRDVVWMGWTSGLVAASWLYLLFQPLLKPSRTPPYPTLFIHTTHLVLSIHSLLTLFYLRATTGSYPPYAHSALFLTGEILTILLTTAAISSIMSLRILDEYLLEAAGTDVQADDKVTLAEWMTFSWVSPLIRLGYTKDLEDSEVPPLSQTMRTSECLSALNSTRGRSLLIRILKTNSLDIFLDASLTAVSVVCNYISPFLIKRILDSISNPSRETMPRAYVYAGLALLASLAKATSDLFHLWAGRRNSVRIKSQLIALVYDKALKRKNAEGVTEKKEKDEKDKGKDKDKPKESKKSKKDAAKDKDNKDKKEPAKQSADSGRVVSLMASDANRVGMTISGFYFIVSGVLEVPVACAFLYSLLGYSAFVGFLSMVVASPLNSYFMKRYFKITQEVAKARDARISVMNEIITAIKFIKFFGWRKNFEEKALEARRKEMRLWVKNLLNSIMFSVIYTLGPMAVTLISFTCYVFVAKRELTVGIAFTALQLFSMIRQPLNVIPQFAVMMSQAYVSVIRIDDFLKEDEVPDWVSSLKRPALPANAPIDTRIGFEGKALLKWNSGAQEGDKKGKANGTAAAATANGSGAAHNESEEEEAPPFELSDLEITFPVNKLSVIVGSTGAGKSAILHALLGEMDCLQGKVLLPKESTQIEPKTGLRNSVAYCSQIPWLQHQTIKQNILFGEEYDEERYHATLEACAIIPDLEVLEDGDETEIGVRGVSLSGGQKARIALARAVYSRNAHLLLDDVFSAVDSHTAKHLLDKCLKGSVLRDRTVIIVSHHVELLLPSIDFLVRVVDGRIECAGSPADLRESGDLEALIATEEATVEQEETVDHKEEVVAEEKAIENTKTLKERLGRKERPGRKLVKDEEREKGSVKWSTYKLYISATGIVVWIITIFFLIVAQCAALGERWWIGKWGSAYQYSLHAAFSAAWAAPHLTGDMHGHDGSHHLHQHHFVNTAVSNANTTLSAEAVPHLNFPSASDHPGFYLSGLAIINFGTFLISLASAINGYWGGYRAAIKIHNQMLDSVLGATVRFYDTTPLGRLINRFSRDVETIDNSLSGTIRMVLANVAVLIGALAFVVVILPGFLLPAAVISYGFYALTVRYLNTSRSLRRIEATQRSPIFSGFGEVLDGITVLRAFGVEKQFVAKLFDQVDASQSSFYWLWMCNRWLLYRFDAIGAMAVFLTTVLALGGAVSANSAGVAILSSQSLVNGIYWVSRNWGQLEMDANSLERASDYLHLEQEPPAVIEGKRPPAAWPTATKGKTFLRAENFSIKYSPELPDVLQGLDFELKAGTKCAVVGRTGSGKSTLAMALLRFTDPSGGKIVLDGIDISTIGLDDLRTRITYIPQDPVLFSGTVRENLDPFQEHPDSELLSALEAVNLGPHAGSASNSGPPSRRSSMVELKDSESIATAVMGSGSKTPLAKGQITLDTSVSAGGNNISAGQRQLLSMARALLRRSNLVIADENTSALDGYSDQVIQKTMRTEFADACVITIAHRLSTIIDYDKVLVLSYGKLVEFDTPLNLLNKQDSVFKSMCEQTGHYQDLYEAAKNASEASNTLHPGDMRPYHNESLAGMEIQPYDLGVPEESILQQPMTQPESEAPQSIKQEDPVARREQEDLERHLLYVLLDSNLPTGGFVASSGLESYIKHGFFAPSHLAASEGKTKLSKPLGIQDAVVRYAQASVYNYARSTLPFVCDAWKAIKAIRSADARHKVVDDLIGLDKLYESMTLNHVTKRSSTAQGTALLTLLTKGFAQPSLAITYGEAEGTAEVVWWKKEVDQYKRQVRAGKSFGHLPVCWGVITAAMGLSLDRAIHLHLFLHVRSILSSAVRLNSIGPYASTQLLLHALRPIIDTCADENSTATTRLGGRDEGIWDWAADDEGGPAMTWPLGELMTSRHDMQHTRIFNS